MMPTSFIDVFKGRERKGTRNKKKEKEEREVNKKHKSNLTDIIFDHPNIELDSLTTFSAGPNQ